MRAGAGAVSGGAAGGGPQEDHCKCGHATIVHCILGEEKKLKTIVLLGLLLFRIFSSPLRECLVSNFYNLTAPCF